MGTVYNLNNESKTLLISLASTEKQEIDKAQKSGFTSPLADSSGDRESFSFKFNGKDVRRFVLQFTEVDIDMIESSQIRQVEFDSEWLKETLYPRIKNEGLKCPIGVAKLTNNKYRSDFGHHRKEAYKMLGKNKIPAFIMSEPYYIDEFRELKKVDYNTSTFLGELSRIKSNKVKENSEYKMEDVPGQLESLYQRDPTFGGINPDGTVPDTNNDIFARIMEEIHPRQFVDKAIRGKIHKKWKNVHGTSISKLIPVTQSSITSDLANNGWDLGIDLKTKERKKFGKHIDENGKAYIGCVSDNGWLFQRNVSYYLLREAGRSQLLNNIDECWIHAHIHNPDPVFSLFEKQRENFLKHIKEVHNDVARNYNSGTNKKIQKIPLVTKVYFAKQLNNSTDQGQMYEFDPKKDLYVKSNP